MPYKKSYRRKSKRPGYRRCGTMVISDAQKALAMAKYLKGIVNVEFKTRDTAQTALFVPDGVGLVIQLSGIAQGSSTNSRDGAQVKCVSVSLEYTVFMDESATATSFRIMLVLDKQTNQAIYAVDDLLDNVANIQSVISPRNLDNKDRFSVLYDKRHVLSSNGSKMQQGSFYKATQIKLRYDGTGATIADLTQNSLSLVVISSEATNTPTLSAQFRLRYVDN